MTTPPFLTGLIDESADDRVYRVGCLVVTDEQLVPLRTGLDQVALRASAAFGVPPDVELHGQEMFHGQGPWRGVPPRARVSVYRQAMDVIAEHGRAVLIKGVHRKRFQARYAGRGFSEHENALTYLMEELDGYANSADMDMHLLADNHRFAAATIRHLAHFRSWGTWGYRGRVIERIQTLTYLDSATFRLIQAADLVCYLHHRIAGRRDVVGSKSRRAIESLWAPVAPLVTYKHDWMP